jgi:hypothetical protein
MITVSYPQFVHLVSTQENTAFVEVLHHGWPYIFVVTTADVSGGQEVRIINVAVMLYVFVCSSVKFLA